MLNRIPCLRIVAWWYILVLVKYIDKYLEIIVFNSEGLEDTLVALLTTETLRLATRSSSYGFSSSHLTLVRAWQSEIGSKL